MTRVMTLLGLVAAFGASAGSLGAQNAPAATKQPAVLTGLEVFIKSPPKVIKGKRIGLITNASGRDVQGRSTIDLINAMPGVKLTALYAPEHGIRVDNTYGNKDEKTGLPIHTLFGQTTKPTPEMLNDVDVLVYDIQDIGVRQYTFESTLALGMKAAAEKGIPYIVLDRPNPVTGTIVEGNLTDPKHLSFVGIYPVASRHGMTVGELARMYNAEQKIGANLIVVPMKGWHRSMWWEQTGLPWLNPSPNIRRVEAEIIYPGSVFFEAVNVSEGRGTSLPLEQVGAPWLDNVKVADAMNAMKLPGVRFDATDIAIDSTSRRKYGGQTVKGIRFVVTDRETFRPIRSALLLMDQIKRTHPDKFQWAERNGSFSVDRLTGSETVRHAIDTGTLAAMLQDWDAQAAKFEQTRRQYLLYK